jgi:putative pyruvate formate lyase activating enzyme
MGCELCPRRCGADRETRPGFCGLKKELRIARIAPHLWEEPPISGSRGSGTVFFTGCNLRCVFCQNRTISREGVGTPVTEAELMGKMLDLQEQGVHNINLVTPTHYTAALARLLEKIKPRLQIPVVWNSSGYESAEALRMVEGLVDVYLPDFKYMSSELSAAYSAAPDYAERATEAVLEMYRQVGAYRERDGLAVGGMILRHLVLPGCRADSMAVLRHIAEILPTADIRVSVMRQYTPDFAMDCAHKNLRRRVTEFEYTSVLDEAARLGIAGFSQGKDAADKAFTPDFE